MLKNLNWKFILRLTFSLLLFCWLVFSVDWNQIWNALFQVNVTWLVLAIGWIVIAIVVSVIKWQLILQAQDLEVSWVELWKAYWIGLFFNNFLPSSIGGDAMRVLHIAKITNESAGVTVSVVMERFLATLALALVGLVASVNVENNLLQVRCLFLLLLLVSLLLTFLFLWGKIPWLMTSKNGKIATFFKQFVSHGKCLGKHPGKLVWALIWSVFFQIANVAVNYSLFQGLQIFQVNLWDTMFVIPATAAVAMIPVGINGYGIREGAYVALLAPYGVEKAVAFTASVLFAFLVSFCSLWGGLLYLVAYKKENKWSSKFESI